jgi:nucleoid-associated protein YgaU
LQIDPEVIHRAEADGQKSRYGILLEPEDTLDLFARWTRRSVAEMLKVNAAAKEHGLVPGEMFNLMLTPGEFARFNGARTAYLAKARTRQESGVEVVSVVRHEVAEGETLRTLLDRYPTSLDLLEKLNPTLRLTGIRAKQVLNIPIVAGAPRDNPAMPGPRPPAPSPVPQPPPEPTPVVAAPEAAPAPARAPAKKPEPAKALASASDKAKAQAKAAGEAKAKAPAAVATYVVQDGETASVIAHKRLKVKLADLAAANPGVNLDRIRPGQKLKRP